MFLISSIYAYKAAFLNLLITYEKTVIQLFILTEEIATLYQKNQVKQTHNFKVLSNANVLL